MDEPSADVEFDPPVAQMGVVLVEADDDGEWRGRGRDKRSEFIEKSKRAPPMSAVVATSRGDIWPTDGYEAKLARRDLLSTEDRLQRRARYVEEAERRRAAREVRDELIRGGLGVAVRDDGGGVGDDGREKGGESRGGGEPADKDG